MVHASQEISREGAKARRMRNSVSSSPLESEKLSVFHSFAKRSLEDMVIPNLEIGNEHEEETDYSEARQRLGVRRCCAAFARIRDSRIASPRHPSSVRSCILALLVLLPITVSASPPDIWPLKVTAPAAVMLEKESSRMDAVAAKVPPAIKPAVEWQKTFLRILSGTRSSEWTGDLQRYIAADAAPGKTVALPDSNPVIAHGIADVSRAWIARTEMEQIDRVLHLYYRKHVAFPDQLQAVEADLPEAVRRDPWGDPWIYHPHAPAELGASFARFTTQRYQLGPNRLPDLSPLKAAIGNRDPAQPKWKIILHDLGGKKALEFRLDAAVTTIEPGGKVDGSTLLFIGDGWALMAGTDQLFTLIY